MKERGEKTEITYVNYKRKFKVICEIWTYEDTVKYYSN